MNAIAAHKDELKKLLVDLSSDRVVSGITFVALVDAYITRLDTNCSDISVRVNPPAPAFSKDFALRPASKRRMFTCGCRTANVPGV